MNTEIDAIVLQACGVWTSAIENSLKQMIKTFFYTTTTWCKFILKCRLSRLHEKNVDTEGLVLSLTASCPTMLIIMIFEIYRGAKHLQFRYCDSLHKIVILKALINLRFRLD